MNYLQIVYSPTQTISWNTLFDDPIASFKDHSSVSSNSPEKKKKKNYKDWEWIELNGSGTIMLFDKECIRKIRLWNRMHARCQPEIHGNFEKNNSLKFFFALPRIVFNHEIRWILLAWENLISLGFFFHSKREKSRFNTWCRSRIPFHIRHIVNFSSYFGIIVIIGWQWLHLIWRQWKPWQLYFNFKSCLLSRLSAQNCWSSKLQNFFSTALRLAFFLCFVVCVYVVIFIVASCLSVWSVAGRLHAFCHCTHYSVSLALSLSLGLSFWNSSEEGGSSEEVCNEHFLCRVAVDFFLLLLSSSSVKNAKVMVFGSARRILPKQP